MISSQDADWKCAPHTAKWWVIDRGVHRFYAEAKCVQTSDPTIYYDGQFDNSSTWDWSLLPAERYNDVIDLVNNGKTVELTKIHNQYNLSGETICCDTSGIFEQFQNAIEKGWIVAN